MELHHSKHHQTYVNGLNTVLEQLAEARANGSFGTIGGLEKTLAFNLDVPPPDDGVRGIDAYRETWPPFFEWQRSGASFEIIELTVTAGADVAFAHALLKCRTADELRDHPERRLRLTIGLRKDDGRWAVTHEHHSFPITS